MKVLSTKLSRPASIIFLFVAIGASGILPHVGVVTDMPTSLVLVFLSTNILSSSCQFYQYKPYIASLQSAVNK